MNMGYAKAELGDFQGSLEALTVQSFHTIRWMFGNCWYPWTIFVIYTMHVSESKKTLSETSFNIVCFKNDQGDLGKIHLQNDSADQFFPLKNQAFQDVLALLTVGSVDALAGCQKKTNGAANWRLKMWVSNWFWSDRFVSFKKGYLSRCDAEDFTFMISGWLESHSKMMKDSLQGFLMFWNTWRLGRYWEWCWWNPPLQSTINAW